MPTPVPSPPHQSLRSDAGQAPAPPKIPTGRELYDAMMHHFEPELTTAMAATLSGKYKNESAEDKAVRMNRYELAFERCDKAYNEYMETLDTQVKRYQREAFAHAEMSDRQHDEGFLDHLGTLFQTAA